MCKPSVEAVPSSQSKSSLPWQHQPWQHLLDIHERERLPHALLLSGELGIGKLHFGLSFCQYLLCTDQVNGSACLQCKNCQLNRAGTHPDMLLVQPEEKSKVIKIDQIRTVVDFLSKTSQQGGEKLVVIAPAESMNINAANSLLKSLEEPAANTRLLLICHRPASLLPTIRSRCQQIKLATPSIPESLPWLQDFSPEPETAEQALLSTMGRPLAAKALLADASFEQRNNLISDLSAFLLGDIGPVSLAQKWQGYDLEIDILPLLQYLIRLAPPLLKLSEWLIKSRLLNKR